MNKRLKAKASRTWKGPQPAGSAYNPPVTRRWRLPTNPVAGGNGVLDMTVEKVEIDGLGMVWLIRNLQWQWFDDDGNPWPPEATT